MLPRSILYRIIIITLITPFINSASALTPSKNLKKFFTSDLSYLKVVTDINQDNQGYMWFATTDGLYKFDGYTLKEYSPRYDDKNSISHFNITNLLIDYKDKMWVGTSFGLAKYQKGSDDFKKVILKENKPEFSPVILKLFEDSKKNIWIGTRENGVFKISNKTNQVTQYTNTKLKVVLTDNFIKDIFEDERGYIWFATINGLNKYDSITGEISHHLNDFDSLKSSYHILTILQHSKNTLLLGTDKGLFEFNISTQKITRSTIDNSRSYRFQINKLVKGVNGEVIIGTNSKGVGFIDRKTGLIVNYQNNNDIESLISNTVYALFLDNKKNLWIGTNNGVSRIDNTQDIFSLYKEGNNHCLPGKESYAILSGSKEVLWVGIRGEGLQKIDLKQGECKLFSSVEVDREYVKLDFILDIKEDNQGNIWIANYQEGLVKFDPKTSIFSRFKSNNPDIRKLLESVFIYKIEIGEDNKVWLGLEDFGLIELDIVEETTRVLTNSINQQLGVKISTVKTLQKYDNKLWITTSYQGLVSIDLSTYEAVQFVRKEKNLAGIPENISAARVDDKGDLWLGSRGYGLFQFNIKSHELKNYTTIDGLADNTIWNIEVDNNGFVWIGTDDGLSVFDPTDIEFTNYYTSDGLQSNEATTSGFFDKKTGVIWTGGMNGINKIDTNKYQDRVREKASVPELDDIKVNYKSINFQSNDNINLAHSENNLTFYFSSINFKTPKKVKYRYKLDGFDQWRVVDFNSRLAHYTNLSPGVYTFKVSASLNNQWSNDEEASIKIIINPPWWQTNLAYFLFIFAFISLVFSIIYFRTRLLMNKANSLERSVMERTKELVKEKHKVELLLSRKNEEFANVSHELRTPLTLIQGPVTKLMAESTDNEQLKRLIIIQRNAIRLTRIVDQLFHIETFRIKSISGRSNQVTKVIILRIIEAFKDLAQEKNIQLNVTKIANVNLEFTPDALEKIILNLISNALKYTQAGGAITVETYRSKSKELIIKISDTGVGIPKDKLGIIFERYSRVLDENSEKVTGAGIGLALVKSLVDSHNGRIELESKLGIGTEVTVYLPIVNEVLEGDNQIYINDEFIAMELMELNHQQEMSLITQDVVKQSIKESEKPLVLLIEDNSDMRAYITDSILSDYKVIIAENGEIGIAKAKLEVPDLIISDIMMPKKDGYQVTNELRHNDITSHIPIVLLTARGDRESRLKGWYEKADAYLTKPFDAEELLIRLKNLLGIRNILKQQFSESSFNVDEKSSEPKAEVCSIKAANIAKQKRFISQLNEILEVLYVNSDTSVANIASEIAMSERQFFRKIKSVLDMTPAEYLRLFRLEKAKKLLDQGNNASYTAFEVGFSSQSYFGKCFKVQFGLSPSEYKKKLQSLYSKETLIPFDDS